MRQCPFTGCEAELADNVFVCRKHSFSFNAKERAEIRAALDAYRAGEISLEELRQRQQAVLGDRGQS